MKRYLTGIAVLLGIQVGFVQAEYLIILANVKKPQKAPTQPRGMQGGAAGQLGALGGAPGAPGAQLGQFGNLGGAPGGALGSPPGGGLAASGGAPGGGFTGGPVGPGGPPGGGSVLGLSGAVGYGGAQGGTVGQPKEEPVRVMTVIEVKNYKLQRFNTGQSLSFSHKWGRATVLPQKDMLQIAFLKTPRGAPLPSVRDQLELKRKTLSKGGKKLTLQNRLDLAGFALEHGLLPDYEIVMDELAATDEGKSHPDVKAYLNVKKHVNRAIPQNDRISDWKRSMYSNYKIASSNHYTLFHRESNSGAQAVKDRLEQLEDLYAGFYYWFAMKGKLLPAPKEKMISVLVSGGLDPAEAFQAQNRIFGSEPLYTNSFFSQRHKLVGLASTRLDDPYQLLNKLTDPFWKKFSRRTILQEKLPSGIKGLEKAIAQTYGLLLTALEEDSEIQAVTHSGAQQLLVASGLIPYNVISPQWVHFGVGANFEIPAGSPWKSYGAPNWVYYFSYEELVKEKKFPRLPLTLLKEIVTDQIFEKKNKDGKTTVRARAATWGLTHFLLQRRLDGMGKYYEELRNLPRDLKPSEDLLLTIFARAFDCVDASTNKPSDAKLGSLAREWQNSMKEFKPRTEVILKEIYQFRNELKEELAKDRKPTTRPRNPGGQPGYPGYPGGGGLTPPGAPGGDGLAPPGLGGAPRGR